jgi:TRAP-type mannitol/chloroaromatic compound transport system permease small subunit
MRQNEGRLVRPDGAWMRALLGLSRGIDAVSAGIGRIAEWCVLAACAVSAGNALMRYTFSLSSNAWLEAQWYLFTGIVMLGAAHTLRRNGHVRVDLVYSIVSERARLWIDVFGIIFFLLPGMLLLAWMTWPFFLDSWMRDEVSPNAGGLLRWPVKLLLPLGFAMVVLQGLAELVKRVAALRGIEDEAARVAAYEKLEQ